MGHKVVVEEGEDGEEGREGKGEGEEEEEEVPIPAGCVDCRGFRHVTKHKP